MSCRSSEPYTTLDLNYSQDDVVPYFTKIGYPCPPHRNPADHVTSIINTDFDISAETGLPNHERIQQLAQAWIAHTSSLTSSGSESDERSSVVMTSTSPGTTVGGFKTAFEPIRIPIKKSWSYRVVAELRRTWILTQRTALIIRRNFMLSGLRFFMYGTWVMAFAMPNLHWLKDFGTGKALRVYCWRQFGYIWKRRMRGSMIAYRSVHHLSPVSGAIT
jgi:hypothetical protein